MPQQGSSNTLKFGGSTKAKYPQRACDGSGLVVCPVCSRQVPLATINVHLDTACQPALEVHVSSAPARRQQRCERGHDSCSSPGPDVRHCSDLAAEVLLQDAAADHGVVQQDLLQERGSPPHDDLQLQAMLPKQEGGRYEDSAQTQHTVSPLPQSLGGVQLHLSNAQLQCWQPAGSRVPTTVSSALSKPDPIPPRLTGKRRRDHDPNGQLPLEVPPASSTTNQSAREPPETLVSVHQHDSKIVTADSSNPSRAAASSPALSAPELHQPLPLSPSWDLSLRECNAFAHAELPGEFLFPDFISADEEAQLLHMLDDPSRPWHDSTFNGLHRGKAWGVRMDVRTRTVIPAAMPLPPLLRKLTQRMNDLHVLRDFKPNEANAIDYRRSVGHHLQPHLDDRQLSTHRIVTLSLVGPAIMTFAREKGPRHVVEVKLPPRALQVITRDARYSYTHAIQHRHLLTDRRVSITFRQSPLTLPTNTMDKYLPSKPG